jgi:hypothetical protein
MIFVSLACNDPDNGCFAGRVERIEVHGFHGCDITLEPTRLPGPRFRWLDEPPVSKQMQLKGIDPWPRCDMGFKLGRYSYGCTGYKYGVGSWCWDGAKMAAVNVRHLLLTLREMGWRCTEAACEFYDAFNGGGDIPPEMLNRALQPDEERAL